MTFDSEDDAYKFYNAYACLLGFSIRRCHTKYRADGTLSSKYFVCSNEGQKHTSQTDQPRKERATTRSSCKARVQFYICREGVWNVQKVILAHNHSFVSPNKAHMLRSQQHLSNDDKHIISKMQEAGVRPAEIYDFLQRWSSGAENVQFLKMDCNNFISRERKKYLETQDAQTLLEYSENKQAKDPSFYHVVQIDKEDGRISNFFWADGQAITDYACFGDVICVDTTFQTNKSEMSFAPILGTNHHRQTIIFGAALLFDESAESFFWLFSNFLKAMSGKHPETIFTYQCAAMAKAIEIALPNSCYRLCIWHIYQNAAKHLSHVIGKNCDFFKDFKSCVYEERSIAHFNMKWQELLAAYNLAQNSWLKNIYALREKWATVYRHDSFSADMASTQRCEGMNNVFKKTFRRKLSISELLVEYDKCAARLHANELYEDYKSRNSEPALCVKNLPLLKIAAESYTRNMYTIFEEEFKRQFVLSSTLLTSEGATCTYKIMSMDRTEDETIVIFNLEDMHVSCKKYTCFGMYAG
jgi:zinc finger SWIM domain-containing protein 3